MNHHTKKADPSALSGFSPAENAALDSMLTAQQQARQSENVRQILSQAFRWAVTAGALGMGARGLSGLQETIRRNTRATRPPGIASAMQPQIMTVPTLTRPDLREKEASGLLAAVRDFMLGAKSKSPETTPWQLAAVAAPAMATGWAGWNVMDHMLDDVRNAELNAEVEQARKDFEAAALQQYNVEPKKKKKTLALPAPKAASAQEKSALPGLDFLASLVDPDTWGGAANMYAGYAVPTMLGTGWLAHNYFKKRQPSALIDRVDADRRARLLEQHSPEYLAVPPDPEEELSDDEMQRDMQVQMAVGA